jgi:hypothetical protein
VRLLPVRSTSAISNHDPKLANGVSQLGCEHQRGAPNGQLSNQGVPAKPPSKRRRANKPKSYGEADPVTAPAADCADPRELGIENPHPLIASMWDTVQHSCEAAFYSEADWQRLRMELWFANHTMVSGRPSGSAWEAIQHGFNELLLSPAIKRRAGIELRPQDADVEANEAVSLVGRYKQVLKSV